MTPASSWTRMRSTSRECVCSSVCALRPSPVGRRLVPPAGDEAPVLLLRHVQPLALLVARRLQAVVARRPWLVAAAPGWPAGLQLELPPLPLHEGRPAPGVVL